MTEIPQIVPPLSRGRRATGFVLLGLGVAVAARVGWLGVAYGSGFRFEEWARFAAWLWIGSVLALTGCWLALRSRPAAWGALLAGLAVPALLGLAYALGF